MLVSNDGVSENLIFFSHFFDTKTIRTRNEISNKIFLKGRKIEKLCSHFPVDTENIQFFGWYEKCSFLFMDGENF